LRCRQPAHAGAGHGIPGFEQRRFVACQGDALAAFEHMVVSVAEACEPDAAVQHHQLAGPGLGAHDLSAQQSVIACDNGLRGRETLLPVHHQSPGGVASIIDVCLSRIQ
jgi:hypothetical protein